MSEDAAKEKKLAEKIISRHLCRIFLKGILKGYDITKFDKFDLPSGIQNVFDARCDDGERVLSFNAIVRSNVSANTRYYATYDSSSVLFGLDIIAHIEIPGNGLGHGSFIQHRGVGDISSTPEAFRYARAIINEIESVIENLPARPGNLLNRENLARLRDLAIKTESLPGTDSTDRERKTIELFHPTIITHNSGEQGNGTKYRINVIKIQPGEFLFPGWGNVIKAGLSDKVDECIRLIDSIERSSGNMMINSDETILLNLCNEALVLMEENNLLLECGYGTRERTGDQLMVAAAGMFRDSLAEVFPDAKEMETKYGNIKRLLKQHQKELLSRDRGDEDGERTESYMDGTRLDMSIGVDARNTVSSNKGPLKSWEQVRDAVVQVGSRSDNILNFKIASATPMQGGGDRDNGTSHSVLMVNNYSQRNCNVLLEDSRFLWTLLFLPIHRAVKEGVSDQELVKRYIRSMMHTAAEMTCNAFNAVITRPENNTHINIMKTPPGSRKNKDSAICEVDAYRAKIGEFAQKLSGFIAGLNELFSSVEAKHFDTSAPVRFPLPGAVGWSFSVKIYYGGRFSSTNGLAASTWVSYKDSSESQGEVPDIKIDLGLAGSKQVLYDKLIESFKLHQGNPHVGDLLKAISDEKTIQDFFESTSEFLADIKRKSINVKDLYYDVFQNDFPEDLMEEYVAQSL